ncbi:MAG TPA: 23S rRNA (guanosine(2251)-2'-O)-methyltransferase RlmB [Spirochaetota bacterium]|nr:23S rRNA (guanosine(2251)-2'-O)-methyltransferase RlmB [Spirochaetota bacterium]
MDNIIFGLNTVYEALARGHSFTEIIIRKGRSGAKIEKLIELAKKRNIQFHFWAAARFKELAGGFNAQGVAAILKKGARLISDLDQFVERSKPEFVVMLDQLTDQHNLGAIARSAYFFGVDLILTGSKGSAPVDATVHKISSGASLLLPFCNNLKLSRAFEILKNRGYNFYCAAAAGGRPIHKCTFQKPLVLLIGSEAKGVRPHLSRQCTEKVYIEGGNDFDSLNAAAAATVFFYELYQQQLKC